MDAGGNRAIDRTERSAQINGKTRIGLRRTGTVRSLNLRGLGSIPRRLTILARAPRELRMAGHASQFTSMAPFMSERVRRVKDRVLRCGGAAEGGADPDH